MKARKIYKEALAGKGIPESLEKLIRDLSIVAINGGSEQFIFGLDAYTEEDEESREYYKKKGEGVLKRAVEEKVIPSKALEVLSLRESYYVHLGALEEQVLVGFDMEKEGCPSALYTRSESILRELERSDLLTEQGKEKLEEVIKAIRGVKLSAPLKKALKESIEEVAINVVKLEPGAEGKYDIKIPQKGLRMGIEQPYMMVPLRAIEILTNEIRKASNNHVIRCKEMKEEGVKERLFTTSELGLYKIYGETEGGIEKVNKRLKGVQVGYDYKLLKLIAYNVEGSVYGRMHINIRPEMISGMEIVKIEELDKRKHNLDYDKIRRELRKLVSEDMKKVEGVVEVDYSDCVLLREKELKLIKELMKLSNSELIEKLGEGLVEELNGREGKEYKEMRVIKEEETLKKVLKECVLKLNIEKKGGNRIEVEVTNNEKELEEVLGEDYIGVYESKRKRYEKALEEAKKGGDIEILKIEYRLSEIAGLEGEEAVKKLEKVIEGIKEKGKEGKEGQLIARRVNPLNEEKYYITIDTRTIVGIRGYKVV